MELEFIQWLCEKSSSPSEQLVVGPGDDAAVLKLPAGNCVVTVDTLMDGVHFEAESVEPGLVGRKALAVNLSDLAAMGALPVAAVLSLSLPRQGAAGVARRIFEGFAELAAQYDVAVAGGDTNTWEGPLVVSVTAIGSVSGAGLQRGGARPGDQIVVSGDLGGSILGKHLRFDPRVSLARRLAASYRISAATDVSDGFLLDLQHVCGDSNCGAAVDLATIPISAAARELASGSGRTALEHALGDGEDFELLIAVSDGEWQRLEGDASMSTSLTRVGHFVPESGLVGIEPDGSRRQLVARGFEHA